ncbi:MAG TPA: aquaporin [Anaeromyxobacter sp.]|nr:aquaporin [Anaeromyxobacter sp.]
MRALRSHWPEYLIEALGLGVFLMSACLFAVLLFHPTSPAHAALGSDLARRGVMGLAMGTTAITLVYSPWGRRSGAHFNPAVTLAFLRLGKVEVVDAAWYIAAQVLGAILGVALSWALLGERLAHASTRFVATRPGPAGPLAAFAAELAISLVLMSVVLRVSSSRRMRLTGVCAGLLVALYITVEAPISGMSMNPARSLGSAVFAGTLSSLWIYFLAPPLGMQLAAILAPASARRGCAKLDHPPDRPCIFCGQGLPPTTTRTSSALHPNAAEV